MKSILLCCSLFLLALPVYSQTWGCPESDFKCQLDNRMKALQADPKNPENYYDLGLVYQRSKNHKEAAETFSMYVAIPGLSAEYQADGYNNRGISYRAMKQPDLAIADYTKAAELFPKRKAQFFTNRGNAWADKKDIVKARADYDAAIKFDPSYALAYSGRGLLSSDQSRLDDAIVDFTKAIELDPAYEEPYYNRGTMYYQRKEYAKAIPDFDKYVGLVKDPVYLADGHLNRGLSHLNTGNLQNALDDSNKVIALRPTFAKGYTLRALVYREMKKPELAAADEKRAAELSAAPK